MKIIMIIIFFFSCNKGTKELITKNKVGEKYWQCIKDGKIRELEEYIKLNNININKDMNEEGETALTLATKLNKRNIVKFLLTLGDIDVNAKNQAGKSALIVSILDASTNFIKYGIIDDLLDKGADVNLRYGIKSNNTLMLAILREEFHIANKVLNKGININYQNLLKETALILAIKIKTNNVDKKEELISRLLESEEIDANIKDKNEKISLTYAVIDNNSNIVKMLLNKKNININAPDKKSKVPFDYLNFEDFEIEVALSLIKKQAVINKKSYFYNKAREYHLEEIISLLIEGKGELSYEKGDKNLLYWSILLFNNNMDMSLKLTKYLIKGMKVESNSIKNYLKYAQERNIDIFYLMEILYEEEIVSYLKENVIELENREEKIRALIFKAVERGSINTLKNLLKIYSNVNIKDAFGNTLLILAVGKEDKNIIRLLINYKADVNARNTEGDTALIIATRKGNKEMANLLVRAGANINEKDEDSFTPLTIAIIKYPEILELFIKLGANFNGKTREEKTLLMIATIYNNKNSVSLLIQKGVKIDAQDIYGWNALMYAIIYSFKDIAEFLIEKGANVNNRNNNGDTPFLLVSYGYRTSFSFKNNGVRINRIHIPLYSYKGHTELTVETTRDKISLLSVSNYGYVDEKILNSLIKAGADINDKNNKGETSIIVAKRFQNKKVVDFLEEQGVSQSLYSTEVYSLNKVNSFSFEAQEEEENEAEALIDAVLKRDAETVRSLIKAGADINYIDGEERTALMHSIEFGYEEIARLLIEYPSLKYKNYNKEEALILAIKYKRKGIIELLIKEEIDVNYENNEGYTPLFLAILLKDIEIMKLLIRAEADINYKNDLGTTLLMNATFTKSVETVKFLIDAGAKIDEKDSQGKTALLFAIQYRNKDIAKLIIKKEISLLYNNNFEVALISKARKIVKERMYVQVCAYIIKEAIKQNDKKLKNTKSEEEKLRINEKLELLKLIKLLPREVFEHILNFL